MILLNLLATQTQFTCYSLPLGNSVAIYQTMHLYTLDCLASYCVIHQILTIKFIHSPTILLTWVSIFPNILSLQVRDDYIAIYHMVHIANLGKPLVNYMSFPIV